MALPNQVHAKEAYPERASFLFIRDANAGVILAVRVGRTGDSGRPSCDPCCAGQPRVRSIRHWTALTSDLTIHFWRPGIWDLSGYSRADQGRPFNNV